MHIKFIKRLTILILFVLLGLPSFASKNYSVRDRLLDFSLQFAEEVVHSPSHIAKLQSVRPESISDSTAYSAIRLFGRDMLTKGNYTLAFEYLKQVLSILGESGTLSKDCMWLKTQCLLILGCVADQVGMQQLSMEYYLKGLKIAEDLGFHTMLGDFYNNIGACYSKAGNFAKAEIYFNRALATNTRLGLKQQMSINYSNLSGMRMKDSDTEGAIDFALKAVQCLDEKEYPDDYYAMQAHLGFLYLKKQELNMAYTWLSNAYRHQSKRESKANLIETCLMLMNLYAAIGENDSLDKYQKETEQLVNNIGNPAINTRFYEGMARLYNSRGETEKAYETTQKLLALKDSAYKAENLSRMEQAHSIYEIEKKAITKEHSMEKWNPVVVFFSMGSIVVVMAGLLTWIIIIRHKTERVRKEKDEANASLAKIRELRINEERKQKEEAERHLNEQQRQLTAITLEKIKTSQQIDEAITEAKQVLLKIPQRDRETQQKLKNVIMKLTELDNEANWEEFLHYFTKVHPEFYRRLDELHPELTPRDRKLSALIALGLSTKDIASLTFREVRSVETSRNRLRKKLGLVSEVNLEDYMHRLAVGVQQHNEDTTSPS